MQVKMQVIQMDQLIVEVVEADLPSLRYKTRGLAEAHQPSLAGKARETNFTNCS
jgi:hypothetical protein